MHVDDEVAEESALIHAGGTQGQVRRRKFSRRPVATFTVPCALFNLHLGFCHPHPSAYPIKPCVACVKCTNSLCLGTSANI